MGGVLCRRALDPFALCTMGTLRNREDDEGCRGHAECWGWNPVCCRVCLLPGSVGMGELVTNGCAKVPCRVSTARNELRGQLAVCQHSSTPPLKFLGSLLFYLRSHFPPWQPYALGNLYLLSQVHFLQMYIMFKSTFAST